MAVERTKDNWTTDHWFGSIATLLAAARVAEAELREIDGQAIEEEEALHKTNWPGGSVEVSWSGGSFTGSFDELDSARADLEARENVESLTLHVTTPNYSSSVSAGGFRGVHVRVEGPSATVVHGLVTTLKRKLEPGVERVRQPPPQHASAVNWFALLFCIAGAGGLIYLGVRSIVEFGWDWFYAIMIPLVLFVPVLGLSMFYDRDPAPSPETLELVPVADEEKLPPPPDDRGPVIRGRDWLRRHPILTLLGVVVVGVASNLISNAISG